MLTKHVQFKHISAIFTAVLNDLNSSEKLHSSYVETVAVEVVHTNYLVSYFVYYLEII